MKPFKLTKGPFAGMEVTSAPQTRVERLDRWVQIVLDAFGHPDAYVTDESSVGDFFNSRFIRAKDTPEERAAGEAADEAAMQLAARRLGLTLAYDDLIADVAERLQGGQ